MRKKSKLLAVILCLALFAAMAMGSGSAGSGETKEIVSSNSEKESDSKGDEDGASSTKKDKKEENTEVTIEEKVLMKKKGIVITAKEYVTDSIWGDGIKLLLENKSDNTVTVSCEALIVNNYMITDLFASEVAPGKKSNEVMYLSSSELKAAGIDSVGQVEIYFNVYDSASFDTVCKSDCVKIKTSQFANMDTKPDDMGTELYNAKGVRIVGKTVDENSFWGKAILLYCENTSGKNIGISVEEMSINGFMMNPFFTTTVYDGKMSLDEITVFSNELEENGVKEIEDVELKFHIYNADSYNTIADTKPISFSAK